MGIRDMKKATKIDYTGLDIEIELEAAQSYVEHRINKGKPLTQRAFNQAMAMALRAHEVGMTPTELIDWTVGVKGWDGINISFTKASLSRETMAEFEATAIRPKNVVSLGNRKTRDIPVLEQLNDRSWSK